MRFDNLSTDQLYSWRDAIDRLYDRHPRTADHHAQTQPKVLDAINKEIQKREHSSSARRG